MDFFLATKNQPPTPQFPPQQGNPEFYFGEGTNDLQIGTNNDFMAVDGLQETIQDVQKILLTEQGANPSFPLYGTTLQNLIGNKINVNSVAATVQEQITTSLQILFLLTQNRSNPAEIVKTLYSLQTTLQSETNISSLLTIIAANGAELTTGIQIGNI